MKIQDINLPIRRVSVSIRYDRHHHGHFVFFRKSNQLISGASAFFEGKDPTTAFAYATAGLLKNF